MGANKSKLLLTEVKAAREAESQMRGKLTQREKECGDLTTRLETQKLEYEKMYKNLESKHSVLQERFIDLKSKFESEELSSGDFTIRSSELSRKLNEALSERDFIKIEAQKQVETLLLNQKKIEDEIYEARMQLQNLEVEYEEKKHCFEAERQVLLEEAADSKCEMQRIKDELENIRSSYDSNRKKLEEEFSEKKHLLVNHYNDERVQLNKTWELKLNEVVMNCNDEVSKFETSLIQENLNLQAKLSTALNDINSLGRKYKLLNNIFEEIRSRFERRESRKEDLERIADLEGQLIIQSEEIERQRDVLKSLKFSEQPVANNANSRRNRRNARKQRQKLKGLLSGNESNYDASEKISQRCRVSSSSSGSSSSEAKGDN